MSDDETPPDTETTDDVTQVVYVGPTVPQYGLVKMNVYQVPYSDELQQLIDDNPVLGTLFVPLANFPGIRQDVINNVPGQITHAIDHLVNTGVFQQVAPLTNANQASVAIKRAQTINRFPGR